MKKLLPLIIALCFAINANATFISGRIGVPVVTGVNIFDVCYATVPKSACYKNAPAPGEHCFNTNKYTTTSCTTSSPDSVVLTMRVFQPITTDPSRRPVMLFLQGGGYASGNGFLSGGGGLRGWSGTDANSQICEYYAREGFVVIAVDYRKGWDSKGGRCLLGLPCDNCACEAGANDCQSFTFMKANYRMVQDIRAAHRKVIQMKDTWNIDIDEVNYLGLSTGAIGILHAAFAADDMPGYKKNTTSSSPTLSSELGGVDQYGVAVNMALFKVAGVYAVAGAIRDVNWIEASDNVRRATIIFGDQDNAVLPCDGSILGMGYVTEPSPNFNHMSLIGSVGIYNRLKAIACTTWKSSSCPFYMTVRHDNTGHGLYEDLAKPMSCGYSTTCGSALSDERKFYHGVDTYIVGTENAYGLGSRGTSYLYTNNAALCAPCNYTYPTTGLSCSTSGAVYRIDPNSTIIVNNEIHINDETTYLNFSKTIFGTNNFNEITDFIDTQEKNYLTKEYFSETDRVYPNPTNDVLNIRTDNVEISEILFSDITGRVIARFNDSQNYGTFSYNIQDLPAGMYLCSIIMKDQEIRTYRVIKK